jgi:DNA-binding winged helix-turn-helix (wHTH) protein
MYSQMQRSERAVTMATATAMAPPFAAIVTLEKNARKQIPAPESDFSRLRDHSTAEETAIVKNVVSLKAASGVPVKRGMGHVISFGTFQLFPRQFLLLENGKAIRIGSRALEMLIALLERPGELVSKEDLMARVWPNTFVDPANLTVQVAGIRRALGDGRGGNRFLINITGRGYRFVAPVEVSVE